MYNVVYTRSVKEVNLSVSIMCVCVCVCVCVCPDNQPVFTVEYDNYSPFLCPINKHTFSV